MHVRVGIVAALLVVATVAGCKDKKGLIVLRNSRPTDVTITLDHKDHVIPTRQAVPVELPPGDYEMTSNGLMFLETKNVSLKGPGDTIIYNVGGGGDLALVSIPEGGGDPIVRPIVTPITQLEPGESLAKPDLNELLPKASPGAKAYFLCTYDGPTKDVGCKPEKK